MNRRGFIGTLAGFAAACMLDPERALWKPGAKTISIPKPVIPATWGSMRIEFNVGDEITIEGRYRVNPITRLPMKDLQRFVIIQTVAAQSRVDCLPVFPHIIPAGQYQNTAEDKAALNAGAIRRRIGWQQWEDLDCRIAG